MKKIMKKKMNGFHKLMKSGRLHKVAKAAGVMTYEKHVHPLDKQLKQASN
tara:strand:- start:16446 stop:16595 length:150 start_codon:yes stop_codon:yes gene_type:complete